MPIYYRRRRGGARIYVDNISSGIKPNGGGGRLQGERGPLSRAAEEGRIRIGGGKQTKQEQHDGDEGRRQEPAAS